MEILIKRFYRTKRVIDSEVYLDGALFCQASESTWKPLSWGRFKVVLHYCKQYQRKMPAVEIRPMCKRQWVDRCKYCMKRGQMVMSPHRNLRGYCPQLKDGNGVYNRTDGSIILGERLVPGVVLHSEHYFARLVERLQEADGEATLIIC